MSEGTPDQPAPPATPSEPTPPASPADPTTVTPTPPAQPGLISAAPVGWSAPPQPPTGPVGWVDPAAPPPVPPPGSPPGTGPTVGWAPVAPQREVAPGLVFADTISRLVAFFVDSFLIGIVAAIIGAVLGQGETITRETASGVSYQYQVTGPAFSILAVVLSLAYFVFFWTGGRRATIGQRIFGIQVGNAFDGHALSLEQAVKRWLALGFILSLLDLVLPRGTSWLGLLGLVWSLVLLVSTVASPTKQGLHDKFANSALVRPSGGGARGLALACALVIGLLLVFAILTIVALILLGSQISDILSRVGESI